MTVYLGEHNRNKIEKSKIRRNITQVIVHPNYKIKDVKSDFDIALMKLQSPVKFSDEIAPICLPSQNINMATIGSQGLVVGWGETKGLKQFLVKYVLYYFKSKAF